jgi:CRP-like cAMP-binding protein
MAELTPGNGLLQQLTAGDRAALEAHLTPANLKAGQVLNEPGTEITHLHFVTEGAVSGVVVLDSGMTIEALFIGREGAVGSMASASPYRSFGRTVVQVAGSGLRMDVRSFRALALERPAVAMVMDRYKSHLHADLAQSVACNAVHRVGPRLAKWLLRCHDRVQGDVLPLTQELMGQMIGSQRTTVTEQAGDLQRAGLIRYHRGQLELLDRAGLERAACECYAAVRARELALT